MTRISICESLVVLYQTWPTFAYTNILMQNSIHLGKEIENFWKKIEKMLLVVHLSFLHAKQLLMKPLFESLKRYENLLLELTLANHTPLDVSTDADRSLYALGFRLRNEQIHTSTKQDPQL